MHRTSTSDACQGGMNQGKYKPELIIDPIAIKRNKLSSIITSVDKVFMSNAASEMQLFFTAN